MRPNIPHRDPDQKYTLDEINHKRAARSWLLLTTKVFIDTIPYPGKDIALRAWIDRELRLAELFPIFHPYSRPWVFELVAWKVSRVPKSECLKGVTQIRVDRFRTRSRDLH